jgi:hypothetical protein
MESASLLIRSSFLTSSTFNILHHLFNAAFCPNPLLHSNFSSPPSQNLFLSIDRQIIPQLGDAIQDSVDNTAGEPSIANLITLIHLFLFTMPVLRHNRPNSNALVQRRDDAFMYQRTQAPRASNMPKRDSALILRAFDGGRRTPREVYVMVGGQLSVDRTEAQIASHAKGLVQKAGQDWEEALRRVIHFEDRHRIPKRKMPFSLPEQLEIAIGYRGLTSRRDRHKLVSRRMIQWYRTTGYPNRHHLLMEGTGSGSYHEKVKNHCRNNLDLKYNGNLDEAIRDIELKMSESEDNGVSRFYESFVVPLDPTSAPVSPQQTSAAVLEEEDLQSPIVYQEPLPASTDLPMVSYPSLMDTADFAADAAHWNLLSAIDPSLESGVYLPLDSFPEFSFGSIQTPTTACNSAPIATTTSPDPVPATCPPPTTVISSVTMSCPPPVVASSSVMTLPPQQDDLLTDFEGAYYSIPPAGTTPLTEADLEYFGSRPSFQAAMAEIPLGPDPAQLLESSWPDLADLMGPNPSQLLDVNWPNFSQLMDQPDPAAPVVAQSQRGPSKGKGKERVRDDLLDLADAHYMFETFESDSKYLKSLPPDGFGDNDWFCEVPPASGKVRDDTKSSALPPVPIIKIEEAPSPVSDFAASSDTAHTAQVQVEPCIAGPSTFRIPNRSVPFEAPFAYMMPPAPTLASCSLSATSANHRTISSMPLQSPRSLHTSRGSHLSVPSTTRKRHSPTRSKQPRSPYLPGSSQRPIVVSDSEASFVVRNERPISSDLTGSSQGPIELELCQASSSSAALQKRKACAIPYVGEPVQKRHRPMTPDEVLQARRPVWIPNELPTDATIDPFNLTPPLAYKYEQPTHSIPPCLSRVRHPDDVLRRSMQGIFVLRQDFMQQFSLFWPELPPEGFEILLELQARGDSITGHMIQNIVYPHPQPSEWLLKLISDQLANFAVPTADTVDALDRKLQVLISSVREVVEYYDPQRILGMWDIVTQPMERCLKDDGRFHANKKPFRDVEAMKPRSEWRPGGMK